VREFAKQRFCDRRQLGLGVAHGRERLRIVGRAEVALALDQRIAVAEGLRHQHQGFIAGAVAVGVELADHVADGARRLLGLRSRAEPELAHRVDDPPLHRLQSVADEGQGAIEHHVHRIVEIGALGVLAQGNLFETVEDGADRVVHLDCCGVSGPAILQGRQRPLARYCVPRAPQATAFRVSMVRAIPAPSSTLNVLARSRGRPATPSRSTATSYSRALASIAVARTQLSSAMPASRIRRTPSLASSTGSAVARNAECLGFSTKWSSGRGWSSAAMRPAGPGVAEAIATSSRKSDCQRAKLSLANTTGQPRSLKRSRSVWMLRAARSAAGAITSASGKSNSPTMSTTTRAGGSGVAILSRGLWPARRAMWGRWRGRSLPAPHPGSRFPGSCGS